MHIVLSAHSICSPPVDIGLLSYMWCIQFRVYGVWWHSDVISVLQKPLVIVHYLHIPANRKTRVHKYLLITKFWNKYIHKTISKVNLAALFTELFHKDFSLVIRTNTARLQKLWNKHIVMYSMLFIRWRWIIIHVLQKPLIIDSIFRFYSTWIHTYITHGAFLLIGRYFVCHHYFALYGFCCYSNVISVLQKLQP